MIVAESWDLALEAISTVPFTFGFVPTDSVVVLSLDAEERRFVLGPCARLDLDAVYAARDAGEFGAMVQMTAPVARGGCSGGLIAVWADAEGQEEASDLLELVAGMASAEWPFEEHWGTFLVTPDGILGMNGHGDVMGWKDGLELRMTRFAMSQQARPLDEGSMSLRVSRGTDPEVLAATSAAREEAAGKPLRGQRALDLTRIVSAAFETEDRPDPGTSGQIGAALEDIDFRDGFLAWALAGTPAVKDLRGIPVDPWLTSTMYRRPHPSVQKAIDLLMAVATNQPDGGAAPALACAAYLAWFAGKGALPRELMEQALEERPEYSLALLVRDALAASLPPPWVMPGGAAA